MKDVTVSCHFEDVERQKIRLSVLEVIDGKYALELVMMSLERFVEVMDFDRAQPS
jgi:hypothetical protein